MSPILHTLTTVGAIGLLVLCPVISVLLVHNSSRLYDVDLLTASIPSRESIRIMLLFWCTICLLYFLPGTEKTGPLTPTGHIPRYTDNGVLHMILFTGLFVFGAIGGVYKLSVLYDEIMPIVAGLNAAAIVFCVYLYFKGCTHPSTKDVTFSGRGMLYDFYAGIELYPRVLGFDVKKIVNCRFSMTFWMLFGVSATAASHELHGEIDWGLLFCSALTFLYLVTFFLWEIGYMRSIDIIEDNAGFMETWGCLVFVPAVYTNHMHCAVREPSNVSFELAFFLSAVGCACIVLTYCTNHQRQVFRETGGARMPYSSVPPKALRVSYLILNSDTTTTRKQNILLVNGFWGIVRHPQYIFELGVAFSWGALTNPFIRHGQSMIYFAFLTVLLFHRAIRDSNKCKRKYGDGYAEYVKRVPYMIVPGVF